jgi:hypothetical protein
MSEEKSDVVMTFVHRGDFLFVGDEQSENHAIGPPYQHY